MKEIDKHVLGRKTYKLNHQEAAIKPPGAGQLWVPLSASLCNQLPAAAHCVYPDCWTDTTGTRPRTDTRRAAETGAIFSPKKQQKEIT